MGGALAKAAFRSNKADVILLANRTAAKAEKLAEIVGGKVVDNKEVAEKAEYIFLGVKPQVLRPAAARIAPILAGRKDRFVVVSMAAGVTLASLTEMLGGPALIRIMPNTPAAVGEGVLLYCTGGDVTEAEEDSLHLRTRRPPLILRHSPEGQRR